MTPTERLHELARIGARERIRELQRELADLEAFVAGQAPPKRRATRTMSAAQRKAVAVRMKKYWAERRKAQKA